jgi:hypothetical protein
MATNAKDIDAVTFTLELTANVAPCQEVFAALSGYTAYEVGCRSGANA